MVGKRDIRDGAAISKATQRRLQRVGVTAGFDNHIGTLLAGQRFDLFSYVSANGVKAEISTVATGNITAIGSTPITTDAPARFASWMAI
ncbi:Uncharacterised protein [Escherichia coli]|uniref:Uncharacterized protein n=1 Tax=Escherichia coli TaxID=562 RepID=A0A376P6I3_ECOLX|nr:Uncharacterised protein [Escherichia coli]